MFCLWEAIVDVDIDISWLVKVRKHFDKMEKEHTQTERKKLGSLSRNSHLKRMVLDRLHDHLTHFYLKSDFLSYWNSLSPEFENLYTLVTINVTIKLLNTRRESASSKTFQDYISLLLSENLTEAAKSNYSIDSSRNCSEPGTQANDHQDIHTAFCKGLKWEVKFVSKSVINLSRRNLSPPEISLLSKGLKFVPSASKIDRAKLKGEREREFEENGRKLHLMRPFCNYDWTFRADKFRPKSSFNPRNTSTIIETYLSCLKERFLDIGTTSKRQ